MPIVSSSAASTASTAEPPRSLLSIADLSLAGVTSILALASELEAEPHLNTCFKHFYYFALHYELLTLKDFEPVDELVRKINADA